MTERAATLEDFRATGALHGANVARCMVTAMAQGVRDANAHMQYHLETIIPAKRTELQRLGAEADEIDVYVKARLQRPNKSYWKLPTPFTSAALAKIPHKKRREK
jgi:hypothetical protein